MKNGLQLNVVRDLLLTRDTAIVRAQRGPSSQCVRGKRVLLALKWWLPGDYRSRVSQNENAGIPAACPPACKYT